MHNIRYHASHPAQKHFATAVRANVNAYFKERGISPKGDARMAIKAVVMLSLYLLPFILLFVLPFSGWMALTVALVMGIGLAGIGMSVMHDAVHGSASKHAWVNQLMGASMYLLGGNVFTWKVQHNLKHHTHTNVNEADQDIASRGPLRFSEHAPLKPVHRFQFILAFFFYGLMTSSKVINDFFMLARLNRDGVSRQLGEHPTRLMVQAVVIKSLYFAVFVGLPILFTPLLWWQVILGWLLMHFVAGLILGTVFQLAHVVEGAEQPLPDDQGIIHEDWAVHEVRTTANFARNNRLLFWYVGGLNYQIEHHLFPHVCHVHYRDIAPIVEQTALEYGLVYNMKPTFRGGAGLSHPPSARAGQAEVGAGACTCCNEGAWAPGCRGIDLLLCITVHLLICEYDSHGGTETRRRCIALLPIHFQTSVPQCLRVSNTYVPGPHPPKP